MARAAEQFRAGDVTAWGVATLVIWAVALLSANVSGIVPPGIYAALHTSRLSGSTVTQLRAQVAALEAETTRLKRDGLELQQRLARAEEAAGTVTRRVGALEVSIPDIVERQNMAEAAQMRQPDLIDDIATGSIDDGSFTFEAEGGTVRVRQRPLIETGGDIRFETVALDTPDFQLPMPPVADGSAMGVAIGLPIANLDPRVQWRALLAGAGAALDGMSAVVETTEGDQRPRLVAGPLEDRLSALALCDTLQKVAIPCEVVPYAGTRMPELP